MGYDVLITVGKGVIGVASVYVILRYINLKGWSHFNEYQRLNGKTFVITGANSGIGKELTRQISSSGGNVVMLCRDGEKAKAVVQELMGKSKGKGSMGTITTCLMDLNSFSSIETAVKEINERVPKIDCLINNAAIMMAPFYLTEDKFEGHIQTNHLGHALLTTLLLPKIAASGTKDNPSRIVFVSSILYRRGTIRDESFKPGAVTKKNFSNKLAYSDSKLASLMYARQLASEVNRLGYPVVINSASPGVVNSNLGSVSKFSWLKNLLLSPFYVLFTKTPSEGASAILYAAASEKTINSNGDFFQCYEKKSLESRFNSELSKRVYKMTLCSQAMYYKNQGNTFFAQGKYDEALEYYSKAIECCPPEKTSDLSIFHQNRAAVYERSKNYKAVIEECTKAINFNKKYVKALLRRAKAYEALDLISDALADITAVDILENFQNKDNLLFTDRLLKQISKTKSKEYFSKRTLTDPSEHFIKNYFSSYCRDPLIKKADNLDAKKLYSMLDDLRKEKDNDKDNAKKIDAKISLLEGTIEIMKGNNAGAEKKLLEVVSNEDAEPDVKVNAYIKLGTIKVQELDSSLSSETILNYFNKAIEIDSENEDIYIHRAQIYLLSEKIENALADLEKCCELAPDFASAVAQKLYVTYRVGFRVEDHQKVIESFRQFEEATKKFQNTTDVYSLYAQMLTEQGEHKKADELFQKAIKVDPNDANLIVHRGILAMQSGSDFSNAFALLEQAIKIDNRCTFAYEMLGTLEVQRGNLVKGIECFDRALENASTEMDCAHLFSLREAAIAQVNAVESLGITLPG